MLKTNFYGLREFTRKLLPKMSAGAAIVNLSSGAGMGWRQNIPLLQEALAINDIKEVDAFVAQHQIHNDGIDNQAAYPTQQAVTDRLDRGFLSGLEADRSTHECSRARRRGHSDTG
ncbi:MAG: hypothetical protein KAJ57_05670 [Woeseiaceae bacterium]|nr:hypothetical protein [Woeseiaceae bacterium]